LLVLDIMTTKNVQTRAKTEIFLLGTPLDALPRTVLPTELDILRRLESRKSDEKFTKVEDIIGCPQMRGGSSDLR